MATAIQPSFSRGELSPALYGRVDTALYQAGLRKARNVIIHVHGGVSNRAGLQFIAPVKTHTDKGQRLIKFQFKTTDTYMLEFGALYMRVIRNDGHVLETAVNITAATAASPVVVTAGSHGFSNGDEVYILAVGGMTELNGRRFVVANKAANTIELTDQVTGANIDGTGFTAYTSGGTVARVFTLTTPYALSDLAKLKTTQSADVMTLTHSSYSVRELTRTDHDAWALTIPLFSPATDHPIGQTVTPDVGAAVTERYQVTAIATETFEESLPALNNTTVTVQSATAADPVVVGATSHGYANGDEVEINGFNEMTEVNGRRFFIANKATNTFELEGEDGSGYDAETTGGTANQTFVQITTSNATRANTIAWTAPSGVDVEKYAVYLEVNGLYGLIGETLDVTFKDDDLTPNLTASPPRPRNPFFAVDDFPGAASYYEQRRVFGGSVNAPDTSFYSQIGREDNMTTSFPTAADDAITATLNAREVNEIRHFVPLEDLLIFTSGSEWRINAGGDSAFSANTINQKLQSEYGSSHLRPIVQGETVLFVHENLSSVRSLGFSFKINKYTGSDMNLLANHLFRAHTIVDWGFSKTPDPIIHLVRSDGQAATLSIEPEQDVLAWTTWDTRNGKFEAVEVMRPSADEIDEAAYFIVKRIIGGNVVRYIERVHTRRFDAVQDAFFVDSGLSLDIPVTITNATAAAPVVITAASHGFSNGDEVDIFDIIWASDYDADETETQPDQINKRRYFVAEKATNNFELAKNSNPKFITDITRADPGVVTAPAHGFTNGDPVAFFGVVGMTEINGQIHEVANATTDTFELNDVGGGDVDTSGFTAYTSSGNIYETEDGSAFNAYVEGGKVRKTVTAISGLRHLAGETVTILADGNVVADTVVAADGTFTLTTAASRVHAGLKIIADIETLDIEAGDGTIQGKTKRISNVIVRFERSRGLLVGPKVSELIEMKQRENEPYGEPTALLTGDSNPIFILPDWNTNGRLWLRQKYPLPMTILAVIPDLEIGD